MASKRLLAPIMLNGRVFSRSIQTGRVVRNAETPASTPAPTNPTTTASSAETPTEETIEITESKRRHVEGVHNRSRASPGTKRPASQASGQGSKGATAPDQANEQPTDFFDTGAGPSTTAAATGRNGSDASQSDEISLDLLSMTPQADGPTATRTLKSKSKNQQKKPGQDRRPGQGQGQGQGRPRREGKSQREGGRADRPARGDTTDRRPVQLEVVRENAVFDTSFAGLFGRASLILPARRGARNPEGSAWAKDMSAAEARKSDLLRLAGSYDLRLRSAPLPSTVPRNAAPSEKVKAAGKWAFAVNPSVGMRRVEPGLGALERLLG